MSGQEMLDVNKNLLENLKSLITKAVIIKLSLGEELHGIIKAIGPEMLHLEKISGREYYDALIVIDKIDAILTRVR